MKKSLVVKLNALALSAVLTACGGGGSSETASDSSDIVSKTPVTVGEASDTGLSTSYRQVSADCSFTQAIGSARNDNLRISKVSWLQSVQQDSDEADTRLAGGKAVKMRIDVLASNFPLAPTIRQVKVYNPSTSSCVSIPVSAPTRVPSYISQRDLSSAFIADIPAYLVQPGMSVSLWLDDSLGRSASEANATFRVLQPLVSSTITETVRIIPIRYSGVTGSVSSTADIAGLIERMYPLGNVNVVVAPALDVSTGLLSDLLNTVVGILVGTIGQMQDLLDTVDDYCADLNGYQPSARSAPKCVGVLPSNLAFSPTDGDGQVVGLAYVGGTTLLTRSVSSVDNYLITSPYASSHWINFNAMTLAHEFGHLMNLDHANCGGATGLDPRLYDDGGLGGGAGYDVVRDHYFSSAAEDGFADVMSYCSKEWMSDRGYLAAMAYRAGSTGAAARVVEETHQWLKISLGSNGWKVRRTGYAPSTLAASSLSLRVSSDRGQEEMALSSAVVSEHHEGENFGPFFIDLGDRNVSAISVESDGVVMTTWTADEI